MQKVQSYLYPNRVILIANLAGFTVENTIVYAKTVKIYKGIDNVIQFDIQNADQKRLDVVTDPLIGNIRVNVMDGVGNAIPGSPFEVTPLLIKGIVEVTIPATNLIDINHQFLKYSVTATDLNDRTIPLYTDSRFSAVGKIEVVESAVPVTEKPERVYKRFSGEIDFAGNVKNHTSAIPCKLYEAVPSTAMSFMVELNNYKGKIVVEATRDSTISVESFSRNGVELYSRTYTVDTTENLSIENISIDDFNYMRVTWIYLDPTIIGVYGDPNPTGTVDVVTAYYGDQIC
jgi:hypothetical protein